MEKQYNLQDLLKFALQQKSEDTTAISQELSDENREFLHSAFNEMTVDVVKEFQKAIEILENQNSSTDDKLNALLIVREYIDNMDFANNFVKVGGAKILISFLNSEIDEVRVSTIYIIAEMSQNNPFCQNYFLEADVMPVLISYITEQKDTVASSALHAVSTLIRNFERGLKEFLRLSGVQKLICCLNTSCTRVFTKSCFIIACMSAENETIRDEFVKQGTIAKLSEYIEPSCSGFDIKMETLLNALSELSKSELFVGTAVKLMENKRKDIQNIIEQNKDLPQCEETVKYAKTILTNMDGK